MKYIFIALVAALFCASCQHKPMVNTISNANTVGAPKGISDRRVYMDPAFGYDLACMDVRESTTNDGYKRIQVFLKNFTNEPIRFNYRFNWYNLDGVEVRSPDRDMWKKQTALPGDDLTLTSVAPKKNCADFKLRLMNN